MNILASLMDPSAVEIASFLGCAFFTVALFNQVQKARGKAPRQIEPQPFEVKEHAGAALEKDCLQRFLMNEKDIIELKRGRVADQREASIHRKSIYDKMEDTRKELVKQNDDIRKELSDKIGDMPIQMVTLLKNTGAIRPEARN